MNKCFFGLLNFMGDSTIVFQENGAERGLRNADECRAQPKS